MKLKILLLTSLLLSKVLFASQDGYISTYIPISDINRGIVREPHSPKSKIMEEASFVMNTR